MERATREQTILCYKGQKNPTDATINDVKSMLGSRHTAFNDSNELRSVGLGYDALAQHGENLFARGDGNQVFNQDQLRTANAEAEAAGPVAASSAGGRGKTKGAKAKTFELSAVLSMLIPEMET